MDNFWASPGSRVYNIFCIWKSTQLQHSRIMLQVSLYTCKGLILIKRADFHLLCHSLCFWSTLQYCYCLLLFPSVLLSLCQYTSIFKSAIFLCLVVSVWLSTCEYVRNSVHVLMSMHIFVSAALHIGCFISMFR